MLLLLLSCFWYCYCGSCRGSGNGSRSIGRCGSSRSSGSGDGGLGVTASSPFLLILSRSIRPPRPLLPSAARQATPPCPSTLALGTGLCSGQGRGESRSPSLTPAAASLRGIWASSLSRFSPPRRGASGWGWPSPRTWWRRTKEALEWIVWRVRVVLLPSCCQGPINLWRRSRKLPGRSGFERGWPCP